MSAKINLVSCHRMPERSFFWKGKQFPVCARCTGIYFGYITYPIFAFDLVYLHSIYAILLILPTFTDGLLQAKLGLTSTNWRRVTTGFMAGTGFMAISVNIGTWIGNLIFK